jgi:KUP system potassium uptake protein
MDEVITPDLASLVCEQIRSFIVLQGTNLKGSKETSVAGSTSIQTREITFEPLSRDLNAPKPSTINSDPEKRGSDTEETISADLARLQAAYDRQVLYIIGKEQMRVKVGTKIWRRILLSMFLWMRDNTRTKVANLRVQTDRVVEVGFVKDV